VRVENRFNWVMGIVLSMWVTIILAIIFRFNKEKTYNKGGI